MKNTTNQHPSAAEWTALEARLIPPWGRAKLVCDGFSLTLHLVSAGPLRSAIHVFVDGQSRLEWLLNDCEVRRRFYRQVTECIVRPADLRAYERTFGKGEAKKYRKHMTFARHSALWTSFGALRRHLQRHNTRIVIEQQEDEGYNGVSN